jgi:DUF1009 family protein
MGAGGARPNSGPKPKAIEQQAITRIKGALKLLYGNNEDDDNILELFKRFADTKEGMKFFAEHLIGKAPQQVENTNLNYSTEITKEEAKNIRKALDAKY